jgi:hypothetical protein
LVDFRLALQSFVRIAQEHLSKVLVRTSFVVWLFISLKGSVSISFDATVYDRQKPIETLVPSYLFSEADRQKAADLKKHAKFRKNLRMSEKTLILNAMTKLSSSKLEKTQQTKKMRSSTPKSFNLDFDLS